MPAQAELDSTYLKMASTWGQLSKARRKKVGCLIVKDGAIISDGYNGTPSGFSNDCENKIPSPQMVVDYEGQLVEGTYRLETKPEVLHAESNAITKLARSTQSSDGSTMYITISPCLNCAKLIIQSGIKRVVYKAFHQDASGINLLHKAGIEVLECFNNKPPH